jgi:SAM-dependent methyltransferase
LAPGSIDVAVFWVSLHHLNGADMKQALERAVEALAPGGLLLLFEPNSLFFPRHIVLNTFLKSLVYLDDEEKLINIKNICDIVRLQKMKPLFVESHNPPYNPDFLKQLRGGWLFYPFVEIMYLLERFFRRGSFAWPGKRIKRQKMLRSGSYVLAIFSK